MFNLKGGAVLFFRDYFGAYRLHLSVVGPKNIVGPYYMLARDQAGNFLGA